MIFRNRDQFKWYLYFWPFPEHKNVGYSINVVYCIITPTLMMFWGPFHVRGPSTSYIICSISETRARQPGATKLKAWNAGLVSSLTILDCNLVANLINNRLSWLQWMQDLQVPQTGGCTSACRDSGFQKEDWVVRPQGWITLQSESPKVFKWK